MNRSRSIQRGPIDVVQPAGGGVAAWEGRPASSAPSLSPSSAASARPREMVDDVIVGHVDDAVKDDEDAEAEDAEEDEDLEEEAGAR